MRGVAYKSQPSARIGKLPCCADLHPICIFHTCVHVPHGRSSTDEVRIAISVSVAAHTGQGGRPLPGRVFGL